MESVAMPHLTPYSRFAPTAWDSAGAFLPDRADWLVAPCSVTRDSGPLETTNWAEQRKNLDAVDVADDDGDNTDLEYHTFNHWACGWLEIALVRPGSPAAKIAEQLAERLDNYPVLNEESLSEATDKLFAEAWKDYGHKEFVRGIAKRLELSERLADWLGDCDGDAVCELFRGCNDCGDHYWEESSGVHVNIKRSVEGCERGDVARFVREQRRNRAE